MHFTDHTKRNFRDIASFLASQSMLNPLNGNTAYTTNMVGASMAMAPIPTPSIPGFTTFSGKITGIESNGLAATIGNGVVAEGGFSEGGNTISLPARFLQWGVDSGRTTSTYSVGAAVFGFDVTADPVPPTDILRAQAPESLAGASKATAIGGELDRINEFLYNTYTKFMQVSKARDDAARTTPAPAKTAVASVVGKKALSAAAAPAPAVATVEFGASSSTSPGKSTAMSSGSTSDSMSADESWKDYLFRLPEFQWTTSEDVQNIAKAFPRVFWLNTQYISQHINFSGIVATPGSSDGRIVTPVISFANRVQQCFEYWPYAEQGDNIGFVVTFMRHVAGLTCSPEDENCPIVVPWNGRGLARRVTGNERIFNTSPTVPIGQGMYGAYQHRRDGTTHEPIPLICIGVSEISMTSGSSVWTARSKGEMYLQSLRLCGLNKDLNGKCACNPDVESRQRIAKKAKTATIFLSR